VESHSLQQESRPGHTDQASSPSGEAPPATGRRPGRWVRRHLPGVALVAVLAAAATALGEAAPVIGAPVFGITLGMLTQWLRPVPERHRAGVAFSAKYVLQASVVLLGLGLSIPQLFATGTETFPVMAGTLLTALAAAYLLGRLLRVDGELRTLIGAGTAICGGSAIAATSAVVSASQLSVAYAISTIFVFNAIAVVVFPMLGHLMDLSQHAFGVWAGTAINDTSSVVAAGYWYGQEAGDTGVVVKLARTTMIIPLALTLAAVQLRRGYRSNRSVGTVPWVKIFPWFIAWFCVATLANTAGLVPDQLDTSLGLGAGFLITMALTGVGLSAEFGQMRRAGGRPLLFGGLLWLCVAGSSLLIQAATGTL
jgi:uncharacterized integral membrane protein (TIGR00698 family)